MPTEESVGTHPPSDPGPHGEPVLERHASIVVLLGLSPDTAECWRAAAAPLAADVVVAASVHECVSFTQIDVPVVVVMSGGPEHGARLVGQTAATAPRAVVVVVADSEADADFWKPFVWDAVARGRSDESAAPLIAEAVAEATRRRDEGVMVEDYHRRLASLTETEAPVYEAVCVGRLNKQIAKNLGVSIRTIEQRRRRVFDKMGVDSAVPLAALAATVKTIEEQLHRAHRRRLYAPSRPDSRDRR